MKINRTYLNLFELAVVIVLAKIVTGARDSAHYTRTPTICNRQEHTAIIDFQIYENSTSDAAANLPECVNVTLGPGQYKYSFVTQELWTDIGYEPITVTNCALNDIDDEVTVCYPLSPQLLTCNTESISEYRLDNLTLYADDQNNVTSYLGDYFLTENGEAILCESAMDGNYIKPQSPRCNYISIGKNDYEVLDRRTWRLKGGGQVISRADLLVTRSADKALFNVCFPLSFDFLSCNVTEDMAEKLSPIRLNHRVDLMRYGVILELGNYYMDSRGSAIYCGDIGDIFNFDVYYTTFHVFRIMSIVGVSFTLVYLLLYASERITYQTRCMFCHAFCLMVSDLTMTVNLLVADITGPACYVYYVVYYMSKVSAFFWIHVLSFDVCQFFSQMQTSRYRCCLGRVSDFNRMIIYCAYSWGCPLALCTMSLILDSSPYLQNALRIVPELSYACWFREAKSYWIFYFGPLCIIIISNLMFFIHTSINLFYASRSTSVLSNRRHQRLFIVCIKLYVTMGLCWVPNVITWIMKECGYPDYWYVVRPFTSLQGVAIFVVYVCKKRNFDKIRRRLCPNDKQRTAMTSSTDTQISQSSQVDEEKGIKSSRQSI